MNTFTTAGILGEAWTLLKKEWQVVYGAFGVLFLLNIIASSLTKEQGAASTLLTFIFAIVGVILQLGIIRIGLDITEGKPAHLSQLISEYRHTLTYIVATIVYGLVVGFGFVLLIIPGIIFALMFSQYRYLIIDKKLGFYQSLSESEKLTRGVKMKLLGFWFVMFLVVLVSVIPLGLGLIISIPLVTLAGVILYRRLLAHRDGVTASPQAGQAVPTPPASSEGVQNTGSVDIVTNEGEPSVPRPPEVK